MRAAMLVPVAAALTVAACAAPPAVSTVEVNRPSDTQVAEDPVVDDPDIEDPVGVPSTALDWSPCDGAGGGLGPAPDCATLEVPRDHADATGPLIDIAVARVATADPDRRIGSLVFNPGGPGGSGIDFLTTVALLVPEELAERFDLVSFDPRGVGSSTAIDCTTDFDDEIDLVADGDVASWEALAAEAAVAGADCTEASNELAPYVGTNRAARDLDALRAALGDEQLSYVGFSYGTRLGATYAELFPDRVRALVLDGAVAPTDDLAEIGRGQAAGFDLAFERFAAACDADADCPVAARGDALAVYADLIDDVGIDGSLPTDDPTRVLTAGELRLGVVAALYSTQLWPVLADALVAAADGDGSLLHALADSYLGRRPDGTYDNSQAAGFAINCADDPRRPPATEVFDNAVAAAAASTWFDDFLRANTGCIGAADPIDPIVIGPADGADPILVIGTTGDPATPYEWSVEMARSLQSGVLYTVEADGHTAFLSEPCVDDVVIDYLVELRLPPTGSSCAADPVGDLFPPPGESDVDLVIALFDCLRDNGADVPEIGPADVLADPSGETLLDGIDPTDPAFGLAVLACQDLLGGL